MAATTDVTPRPHKIADINTLKELEEEIRFLKEDIKKQGDEIEKHIRKLPQHAIKSATTTLLPSFLNGLITSGTWKLLLSGATMFANPFSKGFSFKKNIVSSAKRLGLITLAKTAYTLWSSRRASRNSVSTIEQPGLKKSSISMLNTKRPTKS